MAVDNTPQCVRDVLGKPGRYRFKQRFMEWYFEVDQRGRVYQLDPVTMKRDGLLSPDGWNASATRGVVEAIK